MVMDSEPFRDLHYILQDLNDDRIWVFAEWVRRCTKPSSLLQSEAIRLEQQQCRLLLA